MILPILFSLIGTLAFIYVFWKRLKEDYTQNQIFTTAFYVLFGFALGSIVADNILPAWWFWLSFLFGLAGLALGMLRFRLRLFETLEAGILSSLVILAMVYFYNFLKTNSPTSALSTLAVILLVSLFVILDKHYKRFSWYKSGRVGFSGMSIVGLFFLIRVIIASTDLNVVSFVGQDEILFSGILSFLSFLVVFNLSRSTQ